MCNCPRLLLLLATVAYGMGTSPANAQIRIKLGNDLKPRIDLNPGHHGGDRDNDHDDHHNGNHNGNHHGGRQNWVVRPHVEPHVELNPHRIGRGATFVIRSGSHGGHSHGSYYCQGGHYYYVPYAGHTHHAPQPVVMQFGSFSHVDELAMQLETQLNELCLDMHYNYRHNHGFHETYAEAYQVFQVAKYVHQAEHHNNRQSIREQLTGVDPLFHHVEDDVRGWSRHQHRHIGQGGIVTKLEAIEATLHHLMHDVGAHPATVGEQAPPPAGYPEQAPPPASIPGGPHPVVTPKVAR